MSPEPVRQVGDYLVQDRLGRGSFSTVYRAVHGATRDEVALKVLDVGGVQGESDRFLREARIASRLVHPAIPRIFEVGIDDGRPFIAMELVRGEPLDHVLAARGRLSIEEVIDVGVQLAGALVAAHATGVVHRDIKPANLVLTPDHRLKLLDFGLSHVVGVQSISQPGALIGTVPYMSPEQLVAEPVDVRSDIYSASVVLYELATGRRPSPGDRFETVTHAILNLAPARMTTLGVSCPDPVERVVFKGLAKKAADRYQRALDMERDWKALEASEDLSVESGLGLLATPEALETTGVRAYTPIVGRAAELDRIRAASRSGGSGLSVVFLTGEAGAGKTRLMEEGGALLRSEGRRIVRVRCQREHAAPYQVWNDFFESYYESERTEAPWIDGDGDELPPGILERFPGLAGRRSDRTRRSRVEPAHVGGTRVLPDMDDVRSLWETLLGLVKRATAKQPLALLVDDVQWADEESIGFWAHLNARAATQPLCMLATFRHGEPGRAALTAMLAGLRREDRLSEIEVTPLGTEMVREIIRQRFGESDALDGLAERIRHESEGNPLYVVETLKLLEARNVLERFAEGWHVVGDLSRIPIPQKVADLIEQRLHGIGEEDRELLEVAAVVGDTFPAKVVGACLTSSTLQILRRIRRLEQTFGVLASTQEGFRFSHSKIREYLLSRLPAELLREHHHAVGSALAMLEGSQPDRALEIAEHLEQGGERVAAVAYFEKAADRSFRVFANDMALRTYERARAILEDEAPKEALEARCRLGRKISAVEVRLGRFDDAALGASLLTRLAARLPDPTELGEVYLMLAEAKVRQGAGETALGATAEARTAFRKADRTEAIARVADLEGVVRQNQGRLEEALALFQEAGALRERLGEAPEIARSHYRTGGVLRRMGRYEESIAELTKASVELEAAGDAIAAANTIGEIGNVHFNLGRFDEAAEQYARCIEMMRRTGEARGLSRATLSAANAELYRGDLHRAVAFYRDALALRLEMGNRGDIGIVQTNLGLVYVYQTRYREAILASHDGVEMCGELEHKGAWGVAQIVTAYLYHDLGEPQRALDAWHKARALWGAAGQPELLVESLVGCATSRLALGDAPGAREDLDAGWSLPAVGESPGMRCDLLLGEVAFALAAGETRRACGLVDDAEQAARTGTVGFVRAARAAVEGLATHAIASEPERARARASYGAVLDTVRGAGLRGMELRVLLAGEALAETPAASGDALARAIALAEVIALDVPEKHRAGWSKRSGYLAALERRGGAAREG